LAPKDNPRTDAYGGDLKGRAKLLRDTLQAVRAAVAPGFAGGVRLSPVDTWERRGLLLAETEVLVTWLAPDGADFVHLSLRDAGGPAPFEDSQGPVVTRIRAALPAAVALISAGGIWTHADAQAVLAAGADMVALGRSAIGNPDWPRLREDDEIVRTPFAPEHLRSEDVGEDFVTYLKKVPGMVVGGAPVRTH
jgi:2,4-dienoyl-CoA reductase-like NADH-dependent reductase (Old Yellow Enzyme family)